MSSSRETQALLRPMDRIRRKVERIGALLERPTGPASLSRREIVNAIERVVTQASVDYSAALRTSDEREKARVFQRLCSELRYLTSRVRATS